MNVTRRNFLQMAAAAGLLSGSGRVLGEGPGRAYRTAVIGCGWWGKNILDEALAAGRAKVVGLCDVHDNALVATADHVKDKSGDEPKKYRDYRDLLDREKPEIVIVATPDHWHALATIAAVKAGAHVFVEKPTGHTIGESKAMLRAARASGRVVQVGLHRRIGPHHVSGMRFLKEGKAGKVGMVRLFVYGGGGKETPSPNAEPPKGMDWDLWCGPAPRRPFNRKLHPGGWRNFLDYANGTLGDWGVHWLDQVLWWSEEKSPRRVFSTGGRPISGPAVNDGRAQTSDAPEAQAAAYEFDGFTVTWEHRTFAENGAEKHGVGAYFYGTKGTLQMGWRDGWTFYPAGKSGAVVHQNAELQEPDGHNIKLLWADFLDSIAKGRRPVADVEPAHRATTMSLLGMLSLKVGRSVRWDGDKEQVVGDDEANRLLSRAYREPWQYPKG